ncbi:hypothetical protein POTOM_045779 [Populus tomentosa]|uniref:Thioredoxin domain-containing protein n=1 Tax=Populus tomentosa TaxID=118781 RepID=A0A8X7YU98_POPTO|nr:hypothetical protein POTOM_045779 [Populus tomentosa]
MVSSMVLSSYPSSRLKCSLSNPQSMIMMSSPQPAVALLFPVRLGGAASFAEFRGVRIQMGSKFSTSVVSINTRRNAKVFSRIVSEAQETVVDIHLTSFLDSQISSVPTVTDETWQSLVIEAVGPVMVAFWAPWCGPCRIIHPVIAELSTEHGGKLKCFMLNTDGSPSTVIFFKNG